MSRVPQPTYTYTTTSLTPVQHSAWRPDPLAADYCDEVGDDDFAFLKAISEKELSDQDFEVIDGPAW